MATKDQQDMGSGDARQRTGGFGTGGARNSMSGGGEHGEKRPSNADHDQKIASNRRQLLNEEDEQASRSPEHARSSSTTGRAADDTLGQTEGRSNSPDADRERKSGDIVTGGEHSQFPGTQAGYDDRSEKQRPPGEATDLGFLDKGRNDDLSRLDKDDVEPMK